MLLASGEVDADYAQVDDIRVTVGEGFPMVLESDGREIFSEWRGIAVPTLVCYGRVSRPMLPRGRSSRTAYRVPRVVRRRSLSADVAEFIPLFWCEILAPANPRKARVEWPV